MTIELPQYYDRFDRDEYYDRHLFFAGRVLQAAELNELQSASMDRLQQVTDALFADGDVVSGAEVVVNATTGACACGSGAIYLRGAVRGVPPGQLTIATTGRVVIGIYLQESVVTELQDPSLRDPAISVRNYQEPGAARLRIEPVWGYADDGQTGAFFPIYQVEDGLLLSKAPPPQVDAIAVSIARYDRQSSGGYYISSGLNVTRLADEDGKQVYSMADGVARVAGQEIIRQHARRLVYAAAPDTRTVLLEPHLVEETTGTDQRIDVNHIPIYQILDHAVTRVVTETSITHGAFSGSLDALTHSPVVQILEVTQGETTYTKTDDYKLTADKVDWSPGGLEPAPGSTYSVTYQYIDTATEPTDADVDGFAVPGTITVDVAGGLTADAELVTDTLVQVSYTWAMPRFDLICLDPDGELKTVKGVSSPVRPRVPSTPNGLLRIATIDQQWTSDTRVINNGTKMVSMSNLNDINGRVDTLFALVAEERLALNLTQRDATAKKGVFTDPFLDDDLRDQGLTQTAAIFDGELTLGIDSTAHAVALLNVTTLDARVLVELDETVGPTELAINQPLRTGSMKVNPYDAFSPLPGVAKLTPAVDYWTEFDTAWLSPETRQFDELVWTRQCVRDTVNLTLIGRLMSRVFNRCRRWGRPVLVGETEISEVEVEKVGTRYVDLQFLREIVVRFDLSGFAPNETLQKVIFDGREVHFEEVA